MVRQVASQLGISNLVSGVKRWFPKCADPRCSYPYTSMFGLRAQPLGPSRTRGLTVNDAWYCSLSCTKRVLQNSWRDVPRLPAHKKTRYHRLPLGLLMLERNSISKSQLAHALEMQRQNGQRRIGQCLQQLGHCGEREVLLALSSQLACPAITQGEAPSVGFDALLPHSLMERFHMLPVYGKAGSPVFHFGFSLDLDYAVLEAIGAVLGCSAKACLVSESFYKAGVQSLCSEGPGQEIIFEGLTDPDEMASIVISYAGHLTMRSVRWAQCEQMTWVRMKKAAECVDVLFYRGGVPAEIGTPRSRGRDRGSKLFSPAPRSPLPQI